jgi:hypothetical protein
MPTAKQRYDNAQKKQAISTMEMIIKGLKNGTIEIESQGMWKSLFKGKYSFKVIFKNMKEYVEESE